MKRIIHLLIASLFLASCISLDQPSISDSHLTPSITSTALLVPTSTKTLTVIPATLTATNSVTSTPSRTPTATPPNFDSFLTAQVSWNVCDGAEEPSYKNDLSPDGNWLAVGCDTYDPSKFSGARIIKLDGTILWDVSYYENYGKYQEEGFLSGGQFRIARWSKDGNYAYLVPYFCCVDAPQDIFFNYFQNTLALYRLDLETGKITATLRPFKRNVFSGYSTSISPTDKYLVYVISNSPRDVHVSNLQNGNTFIITVDESYIASGRFSWSQDGNKAIFVAVKSGWGSEIPIDNGVSYFLLDLKTGSSLHIFDQDDMHRVSWTQEGNIILHNVSGKDGLLYNFQSNTFIAVTPTPTP